jgi:hypothetical protein
MTGLHFNRINQDTSPPFIHSEGIDLHGLGGLTRGTTGIRDRCDAPSQESARLIGVRRTVARWPAR